MEKKRKILQVYGLIICIVSIITIIICISVLVSNLIDRSAPLYSGFSRSDLSSFESYKMEVMKSVEKDQAFIPDDEAIKQMYESAKEEKINRVMHNTMRNIMVSGLIIVICIILFFIHWLMIRKYNKAESIPEVS